jgi:hypothetical protein
MPCSDSLMQCTRRARETLIQGANVLERNVGAAFTLSYNATP